MEGGLERNNSMFGKDSIISKRKKVAITTAVVIVVLVVIIGLAVGVSQKKHHSSKSPTKGEAPPASPTEKPITTNPGDLSVPSKSLSIQRQTVLARNDKAVNPAMLDKFLAALQEVASSSPLGNVNVTGHKVSTASLLMYIRDANIEAVLNPLIDFANSTALSDLSPTTLADLVSEVRKVLKPQAIKDWGKLLAKAHTERGNMSANAQAAVEMVKAAAAKGALRSSSITTAAIAKAKVWAANNTKTSAPQKVPAPGARRLVQEDRVSRLGRKLAAADPFQAACIPVVFHVLQFDDTDGSAFPGTGFSDGAQNLIDRLNLAYTNDEWSTVFNQDAADTMLRFRLQGVVEDRDLAPYLGVTVDQWATCADDIDFMSTVATAASADYPNNQYINVIICGDPGDGSGTLGYAFVPDGQDVTEDSAWDHIFLRYDEFSMDFTNNDDSFNRGGWTLTHEVGHHLGLHHPHPKEDPNVDTTCTDGDGLEDTPTTGVVQLQYYYADLNEMCDYWRLGYGWEETSSGGLTLADMSSCSPATSVDPVFNIMEYTAASCYSYFTPQQVAYLQYTVLYFRPQLYASAVADFGQCTARK